MKRYLLIFVLIISTVVAYAQKYQTPEQRAKLEAKHGIRDIKLDTPKSSYNDLFLVEGYKGCGEMMQRKNENLYIGNIKVREIQYFYLSDNLEKIKILVFDQNKSYEKLIDVLKSLYGPLSQEEVQFGRINEPPITLFWKAKTFTVYISIDEVAFCTIEFVKNDFYDKCKGFEK